MKRSAYIDLGWNGALHNLSSLDSTIVYILHDLYAIDCKYSSNHVMVRIVTISKNSTIEFGFVTKWNWDVIFFLSQKKGKVRNCIKLSIHCRNCPESQPKDISKLCINGCIYCFFVQRKIGGDSNLLSHHTTRQYTPIIYLPA